MKSKADKQIEAEARQAERDKRTAAQQLARLDKRPGNSKRERERLEEK